MLAASPDIQGAPDWSPDGRLIVVAGRHAGGLGMFAIPLDGCAARRLASAPPMDPAWLATDPAWSPNGDFVVYSGVFSSGNATAQVPGAPLQAVRLDGSSSIFRSWSAKPARARPASQPRRVSLRGSDDFGLWPNPESLGFWLFNLVTGEQRQLTKLANKGSLRGLDVTPGGRHSSSTARNRTPTWS